MNIDRNHEIPQQGEFQKNLKSHSGGDLVLVERACDMMMMRSSAPNVIAAILASCNRYG
jgi:hypothetical protein